jgi:HPt (histidine-containing phosphotransfer) domain-containing protein
MADKKSTTAFGAGEVTVRHSLQAEWSQADLGDAFDVSTLSVLADLDPTGARGVVREVLELFARSLEPELDRLERHLLTPNSEEQILFEVHRMGSAAAQIGALRLAAACRDIEVHVKSRPDSAISPDTRLMQLVEMLLAEIVRVQRRLRKLLQA